MFDPILNASTQIQIHVAFACVALLVGPLALFRLRRDRIHKIAGYIWIVSILGLAVSSLWIKSEIAFLWSFGPIHLLSAFATWGVIEGLYHIRTKDMAKHRASMQSVWFGAMGLAGLFTFLPGRVINRMVFGGPSQLGYVVVGVGLIALLVLWRWHLRRVSA